MTAKKNAKKRRLTPVPQRRQVEPPAPAAGEEAEPDLSHLDWIAPNLRQFAVPCASLEFDPANTRRHDEQNLSAIRASLRKFGQVQLVLARSESRVVAIGNGRLAAALSLGHTHIAADFREMSATEAAQLSVADNRSSELGAWDEDKLLAMLAEMPAVDDVDLERMFAELREEMTPAPPTPDPEPDGPPPPSPKALTCPACGHVWGSV